MEKCFPDKEKINVKLHIGLHFPKVELHIMYNYTIGKWEHQGCHLRFPVVCQKRASWCCYTSILLGMFVNSQK